MSQKNYFAIVHKKTGNFLLNGATLPIYWLKKVAVEKAKEFPNYIVQPVLVSEIEELVLKGNIQLLNKK